SCLTTCGSYREMQADMVGLLLGQVEDRQAGLCFDVRDALGDAFGCGAAEYEPHVPGVFAAVVVGDFGHGGEDLGHRVEAFFRYGQGCQGEGAAKALDVEHRPKARSEEHTSELQSRENLVC